MRYILAMVLFVFTLGVNAMTLPPVSVTNDTDLSYDSIDNDYQTVSVADFIDITSFEFYDEPFTGNTFSALENKAFSSVNNDTFAVNDVGKFTTKDVNYTDKTFAIENHSDEFRRARDGLMCSW